MVVLRMALAFALFGLITACAPISPSTTAHSKQLEVPIADPASASANAVAFRALSLVGTPYVYGGESPQIGFDCSGFTRFIYRDALGIVLARTAQAQSELGRVIYRRERLRLGDLLFFSESGNIFHVGLYVGEGRFVHAPRTGKSVELSSIANGYWAERFEKARRVL